MPGACHISIFKYYIDLLKKRYLTALKPCGRLWVGTLGGFFMTKLNYLACALVHLFVQDNLYNISNKSFKLYEMNFTNLTDAY